MRNIQLCGDCDKKLGSPDLPPHCLRVHVHTCTHVHTRACIHGHTHGHIHMRVPQGAREPCERCYTLGAGVNGVTAIMGARQSGKVRKLFAQKHRRSRGGPLLPPAPPRRPAAPRQDAPGALPDLAPSKVAFPQPDWCGWVHCHLTDGSGPPEVCGGVAAPHCFLGGGDPGCEDRWGRASFLRAARPPHGSAAPQRPLGGHFLLN